MKPGRHDIRHQILVEGAELHELHQHTVWMAESFGLDRRIEEYRGTRLLGLYQWDLECLLEVLDAALADRRTSPSQNAPGYQVLNALNARLRGVYEAHYGKLSG